MAADLEARKDFCNIVCGEDLCVQAHEVLDTTARLESFGPELDTNPKAIPTIVRAMDLFASCNAYHDWVQHAMDLNNPPIAS